MADCEHKFVFRGSTKSSEYNGFTSTYERHYFYFCDRCLEERQKTKRQTSRDVPAWWCEESASG